MRTRLQRKRRQKYEDYKRCSFGLDARFVPACLSCFVDFCDPVWPQGNEGVVVDSAALAGRFVVECPKCALICRANS
jgi:hypothetical protein